MMSVEDTFFKLHQLENAEELRKLFADHGIKARRLEAFACAVTEFVRTETGAAACSTTQHHVRVYPDDNLNVDESVIFCNTPAMTDFVNNFDEGRYPELIV